MGTIDILDWQGDELLQDYAYGCSKCGTGRSINGRAVYKTSDRTYYEGRLYIFNQHEPVEVDEILGKYLLSHKASITPLYSTIP